MIFRFLLFIILAAYLLPFPLSQITTPTKHPDILAFTTTTVLLFECIAHLFILILPYSSFDQPTARETPRLFYPLASHGFVWLLVRIPDPPVAYCWTGTWTNPPRYSINVNDPSLISLVNKLQDVFATVGVSFFFFFFFFLTR